MSQVYVGYSEYGLDDLDDELIQFVFEVAVTMAKLDPNSEVGLVLTSDEQMQKLNSRYRGKDKPTNILSFGYLETSGDGFIAKGDEHYLGDIYISRAILLSEAKEMKISNRERFSQLFVHGILHLAGMDHEDDAEATEMEDLEDKILEKLAE